MGDTVQSVGLWCWVLYSLIIGTWRVAARHVLPPFMFPNPILTDKIRNCNSISFEFGKRKPRPMGGISLFFNDLSTCSCHSWQISRSNPLLLPYTGFPLLHEQRPFRHTRWQLKLTRIALTHDPLLQRQRLCVYSPWEHLLPPEISKNQSKFLILVSSLHFFWNELFLYFLISIQYWIKLLYNIFRICQVNFRFFEIFWDKMTTYF